MTKTQERLISWIPPPSDGITFNWAGSSLHRAGFSGRPRNNIEDWIIGFVGASGEDDILHMKLWANIHGLSVSLGSRLQKGSWLLGFPSCGVVVESPPTYFYVYVVLIANIRDMLERWWEVRVALSLQEGKVCANFLAKTVALF